MPCAAPVMTAVFPVKRKRLRWGSAFVATFVAGFFSVFLVVAMGPP
jgi:hypothetical protein